MLLHVFLVLARFNFYRVTHFYSSRLLLCALVSTSPLLPHAHMQGLSDRLCPSVVVCLSVGTKIPSSPDPGRSISAKYFQTV